MTFQTLKRVALAALLALGATAHAGDSYDHRVDESKNAMGPNRCVSSVDCDGKRTCSPWGWCQGKSRPQATVEPTRPPLRIPTPEPAGYTVGGDWEGSFQGFDKKPIKLRLELQQDGNRFSGRSSQAGKGRGKAQAVRLGSIEDGETLADRSVRFKKSMDDAQDKVPVYFQGVLSADGQRLEGDWKAPRGKGGKFSLKRVGQAAAPVATAVATPAPSATPFPYSISGDWEGDYAYEGGKRPPVDFTMTLYQDRDSFTGRCTEPDTYSGKNLKNLYADIEEGVADPQRRISFKKQMDGTGGVKHFILYQGWLSSDGASITGKWQIPQANAGSFRMRRVLRAVPTVAAVVPTTVPVVLTPLPGVEQEFPPKRELPVGAIAPSPVRSPTRVVTPRPTPTSEYLPIGGNWYCETRTSGGGHPDGLFEMKLYQDAGHFTGRSNEQDLTPRSKARLYADLNGEVWTKTGRVTFNKRLEASGLSTDFDGLFSSDGRRISGSWTQSDGLRGTFTMSRDEDRDKEEGEVVHSGHVLVEQKGQMVVTTDLDTTPTPVPPKGTAKTIEGLGGAWSGKLRRAPFPDGKEGDAFGDLALSLSQKGAQLVGHGIYVEKGDTRGAHNVTLSDGTVNEAGDLQFTITFEDPADYDSPKVLRGRFNPTQKLLKGTWSSKMGDGPFELHAQEGGQ